MIDKIIDYNKTFVEQKGYEKYLTDKYPDKKLAVLSCMDTRLTELLPAALGLKNGDAKIIRMRLEGQVFDFFVKRSITCPRDLCAPRVARKKPAPCGAGSFVTHLIVL